MRIYLDSSIIIYLVEQVAPFVGRLVARLEPADELVISELTRLECRVKPLKESHANLLQDYEDFFESAIAQVVTLSRRVMEEATRIRAVYGFKTPDSIHLAAAMTAGCDIFLTNDHRLIQFKEISIDSL